MPASVYVIQNLGQEIENWFNKTIDFLPNLLWGIFIIFFTFLLAKQVRKSLGSVLKKSKIDRTILQLINLLTYWVIIFLGIIITLSIFGLKNAVTSLVAGAGFTSVIIAFGTQDISKNVIAGIFILVSRQFKIGDNIVVQGMHEGIVRKVTIRSMILESSDGRQITVPSNTLFSNTVVNLTAKGKRKVIMEFNIKSSVDINSFEEKVTNVLLKQQSVFKRPRPEILLKNFTSDKYIVTISYWTDSSPMIQRRSISEVNLALDKMFKKEGIMI